MKLFQSFQFKLEKIIEYGIYLLAFLLPLQTRLFLHKEYLGGAFWEYGTISLYLVDILTILLFLFSTIVIFKKRSVLNIKKIWIILAFFELFVFISIFFADNKLIAIYAYLKILLGLAVFFIITENKFNKKILTLSFLSGVFWQSLIGIFQFFQNFSWASKYLGMAKHDPDDLGVFVIELEDKSRHLRAYGGLDHPNIYGFFIFLGIFIFVKYLLTLKNRKQISQKKQFVYFLILSFFFFSFLISFSRASFLVFILYFIFLLSWSIYDRNRRWMIFKIIFTFILVFMISFLMFTNLFIQRFSQTSRLENISNTERVGQYIFSRQIIKDNFFYGLGMGNYSNELYLRDMDKKEAWNYQPVHNVYVLSFSELGFFGFLSFILVLVYFYYSTIKKKIFFDVFLLFSVTFLFLFDHWFWSLHFGVILFLYILAIIQNDLEN